MEKERIICLIKKTRNVILLLRQNKEGMVAELNCIVPEIIDVIKKLVLLLPEMDNGDNLNQIVLERLRNFDRAYKSSDIILLADVLQYEVIELLYLYIELTEHRE